MIENYGRPCVEFGLIGDVLDELRRGDAVRWGESVRETIAEKWKR